MNERGITLLLAGDVMTGRRVDQIRGHPGDPALAESHVRDARTYVELAEKVHGRVPAPVDPPYIWGDALPLIERLAPDAIVVNLETAVTTSAEFCADKDIHYRMHPRNVGCLAAARIDLCALANNHMLDFGRAGLVETLDTLAAAGITTVGAGRDLEEACRPARIRAGLRGAVLAFACGSVSSGIPEDWAAGPSLPGVNLLTDLSSATADALTEPICRYKRPGDVVVGSIHWGSNWGFEVPPEHVAFAHRLIVGGVDVIHGHSSHHVRPIEVYRGKLILYGCGDLVTDYEGIHGYEAWRGDLGVVYFARVAADDGTLVALQLAPMRAIKLRLGRAQPSDAAWLADTSTGSVAHSGRTSAQRRWRSAHARLRWARNARGLGPKGRRTCDDAKVKKR